MGSLGEIRLFAGNFAPAGWLLCNGQTLSIAEYDALFSAIGIMFGGNGETTFNVPNLSDRVPIHGGKNFSLGQSGSAPFGLTNPTALNYVIATQQFPSDPPWVGEVRTFAFGLIPQSWSTCAGQLLPIRTNTALFSLLGSTYGGDGATNFGLPNLKFTGAVGANAGQAGGIGWLMMNFCIALTGIFPQRP